MESKKIYFWMGLGIGSVLGAAAYCFSRTERAATIRREVLDTLHDFEAEAKAVMETTKTKAADVGARAADKLAEKATEVRDKLKEAGR